MTWATLLRICYLTTQAIVLFDCDKAEDHSAGSEDTTLITWEVWSTVLAVLREFTNLPILQSLLSLSSG